MTAAAVPTPTFQAAPANGPENTDVDDAAEENAAADQGDDTADGTDDADKDWKAEFEAQQRINKQLERKARREYNQVYKKALEKAREQLQQETSAKEEPVSATDTKPKVDVEKMRAEAIAEAKKEAQQEALKERVNLTIEAKAAKGFADPVDAVVMLLRDHEIDDFIGDDNKIDGESIQDALKELLEQKPYLGAAAQGGKTPRFQGSAEGGAKPQKPARPQSLDEAVRRRLTPK